MGLHPAEVNDGYKIRLPYIVHPISDRLCPIPLMDESSRLLVDPSPPLGRETQPQLNWNNPAGREVQISRDEDGAANDTRNVARRWFWLGLAPISLALLMTGRVILFPSNRQREDASDPMRMDAQKVSTDLFQDTPSKQAFKNASRDKEELSFGQLAQVMVPKAYQKMLLSIHTVLTPRVRPEHVQRTRKLMLTTRDLLDCFSPVYPNNTATISIPDNPDETSTTKCTTATTVASSGIENDKWSSLRRQLDQGYTLVGKFLDLNHAHIPYRSSDLKVARDSVLTWKQRFDAYVQDESNNNSQTILLYLQNPIDNNNNDHNSDDATTAGFAHDNTSRLFWKEPSEHDNVLSFQKQHPFQLPNGGSSGTTALRALVRKQLDLAIAYFVKMNQHQTIFGEENITADVVQEDYHNFRKGLRTLINEYNLFTVARDIQIFGGNNNDSNPAAVATAVTLMETARTLLGDMNDRWTAHQYQTLQHGSKRQRQHLKIVTQHIERQWQAYRLWSSAEKVNMLGTLQYLRDDDN